MVSVLAMVQRMICAALSTSGRHCSATNASNFAPIAPILPHLVAMIPVAATAAVNGNRNGDADIMVTEPVTATVAVKVTSMIAATAAVTGTGTGPGKGTVTSPAQTRHKLRADRADPRASGRNGTGSSNGSSER